MNVPQAPVIESEADVARDAMAGVYDRCFCGHGTFESAAASASVRANVRRLRDHLSTVWQCAGCGSLHARESVALAPLYEDYPFGRRIPGPLERRMARGRLRRLRQAGMRKNSSILDYGCGNGLFLDYFRQDGYAHCTGFDPYCAPFDDEKVLARTYDAVICQDVIEHVEDPLQLMARLARLTRSGGLLLLGTPRADDIDLANPERSIHSLHQPFHRHILSEQALFAMARSEGFDPVMCERGHCVNSAVPFSNWPFMKAYLNSIDGTIDAGFDPPRPSVVLRSPLLIALGLFGRLLSDRSEMITVMRKI
jgi:SAM-dependent methyltransferase